MHQGRLITLFSASYYCGLQTNKGFIHLIYTEYSCLLCTVISGAFLCVGRDLQPEIQQFYAASLAEVTWEVSESLQVRIFDRMKNEQIT
jgi:hypothetical protein